MKEEFGESTNYKTCMNQSNSGMWGLLNTRQAYLSKNQLINAYMTQTNWTRAHSMYSYYWRCLEDSSVACVKCYPEKREPDINIWVAQHLGMKRERQVSGYQQSAKLFVLSSSKSHSPRRLAPCCPCCDIPNSSHPSHPESHRFQSWYNLNTQFNPNLLWHCITCLLPWELAPISGFNTKKINEETCWEYKKINVCIRFN